MKQLLLILLSITFSNACFSKIWRVNNNPGVNADFTTLQAAHDGAASGDTLHIESSPTHYGYGTFTKKLIVIGTGYYLDQNLNLQAFTLPSLVAAITLSPGSDGSVLEGLSFVGNVVYVNANDITIRRNNFASPAGNIPDYSTGGIVIGYQYPVSNIVVSQNFSIGISNNQTASGVLILNNYITRPAYEGDATAQTSVSLLPATTAILKNNIFRRGAIQVSNSNLSNNIMYAGTLVGTGNLLSNNIGSGTQFGTANGNQENVSMAAVFEMTGSYDGAYKLKAGSPAIGAGFGSTVQNPVDCGMFGGTTPYVLSGLPAIPSIYYFTNQPVGSNSDPIDVQIKVRSNN